MSQIVIIFNCPPPLGREGAIPSQALRHKPAIGHQRAVDAVTDRLAYISNVISRFLFSYIIRGADDIVDLLNYIYWRYGATLSAVIWSRFCYFMIK